MIRVSITLAAGLVVGAGAVSASHHNHDDGEKVEVLSATNVKEKLDGREAMATVVKVTIEPGQSGVPHRHPGPGFGYVVEGEYELGIDDQPARLFKAGETFYEPTGCLHRVSKNPGKGKTRLIAVVLHPRDAKQIAVQELKQN